jgi:hypothetical protein
MPSTIALAPSATGSPSASNCRVAGLSSNPPKRYGSFTRGNLPQWLPFQKVSAALQPPKGLNRPGEQNLRTAIPGLSIRFNLRRLS